MPKQIDITLKLNDQLTNTLRRTVNDATKQVGMLQNQLSKPVRVGQLTIPQPQASKGNFGLGMGDLVGANLLSSAIGTVAEGVLAAGSNLVGAIVQAYQGAEQSRSQTLSASSAISTLLDISYQDAKQVMDKLSVEISDMAVKLP
jgi:hypothetical protein